MLFEIAPDVAVTVTCEVPVGVGSDPDPILLPPPHPATPDVATSPSNTIAIIARNLRLPAAPNRRSAAKGVRAAMAIPTLPRFGGAVDLAV